MRIACSRLAVNKLRTTLAKLAALRGLRVQGLLVWFHFVWNAVSSRCESMKIYRVVVGKNAGRAIAITKTLKPAYAGCGGRVCHAQAIG